MDQQFTVKRKTVKRKNTPRILTTNDKNNKDCIGHAI